MAAYVPDVFADHPEGGTPITAAKLNKLGTGVQSAQAVADAAETPASAQARADAAQTAAAADATSKANAAQAAALATVASTYVPLLSPPATFTYNPDGTIATQSVAGRTITYTWNTDGTLASETDGTTTRTYAYDSAGNLTGVS